MSAGLDGSAFPIRSVLQLALACLATIVAFNLIPFEPTDELPAVAVPKRPPTAMLEVGAKPRVDGEVRVFVAGASLTAGYPYVVGNRSGYADLLGAGLQRVWPERKVSAGSYAQPALDSPKLADMVEQLLELDPSVVCVSLGSNEFANRIWSGKNLNSQNAVEFVGDRASRGRVLWRKLPVIRLGEASGAGLQARLAGRLVNSKNGEPRFGGLPVPDGDRALIVERMRRSMRRMAAACKERGVPLVFLQACYGLDGSWPWGVSHDGLDAQADRLVFRLRRGDHGGLLADVDAALAKKPQRADLHYVRGRLLRLAGRAKEAHRAFVRARDLDPIPMHLTSAIANAIEATARELDCALLRLDDALLAPDGLNEVAQYLDYGHVTMEGHRRIAAYLADKLSALGRLPALPSEWRPNFDAATTAHVQAFVPVERVLTSRLNISEADGNFAMLFGNFREAMLYWRRAFEEVVRFRPAYQEKEGMVAASLIWTVWSIAGRYDEIARLRGKAFTTRMVALHAEMSKALAEKRLDAWIWDILGDRAR